MQRVAGLLVFLLVPFLLLLLLALFLLVLVAASVESLGAAHSSVSCANNYRGICLTLAHAKPMR